MFATRVLRQALCYLKGKNYVECIQSCTNILRDGVHIISLPLDNDSDESADKRMHHIVQVRDEINTEGSEIQG